MINRMLIMVSFICSYIVIFKTFSACSSWHREIQPKAWELSLLQPIYQGVNKLQTDPASYSGIYLGSALAKLFEGIHLHRLTQHTTALPI
jgi:hypothetical protein